MRNLTPLEKVIWNQGERLIPGVTHDLAEVIRHRSSYFFFRKVIENDLALIGGEAIPVRIVDLGCGIGYGCRILSELPNSQILGVERSRECLEYARVYYGGENIDYRAENLLEYIPRMSEYDYVVSRGVFEHVADGLQLALSTKWRHRLIFDVPYNEPRGKNPHHVKFEIREETFSEYQEIEFFFQDMGGIIHDREHRPVNSNMMICVWTSAELPKVSECQMTFPFPAWQPGTISRLSRLRWSKMKQKLKKGLQKYSEPRIRK